jgi:type II secretory pathway pseudopilin PulG
MVRARQRPSREAGYNLVFLVVLLALLSVAAAAMLPDLATAIQREKEAELIFRGTQYAEGIRVFQARFGRYPNTLRELVEVEPRSMRQLWPDPMMRDGRWGLVLATGQPTQGGNGNGAEGEAPIDTQGRIVASGAAPKSSFRGAGVAAQPPSGPIIGVVSRKKGVGLRTFLGLESYEQWRFTPDMLPKALVIPGTQIVVRASVEDLGKPFPRGLQPPGFANQDAADLARGTGLEGDEEAAGDDGGDG